MSSLPTAMLLFAAAMLLLSLYLWRRGSVGAALFAFLPAFAGLGAMLLMGGMMPESMTPRVRVAILAAYAASAVYLLLLVVLSVRRRAKQSGERTNGG